MPLQKANSGYVSPSIQRYLDDFRHIISVLKATEGKKGAIGSGDVEPLLDYLDEVLTERESSIKRAEAAELELQRARFSQLGDNHHNAMKCHYCNPEQLDPTKLQAENARLREGMALVSAQCIEYEDYYSPRSYERTQFTDLRHRIETLLGNMETKTQKGEE